VCAVWRHSHWQWQWWYCMYVCVLIVLLFAQLSNEQLKQPVSTRCFKTYLSLNRCDSTCSLHKVRPTFDSLHCCWAQERLCWCSGQYETIDSYASVSDTADTTTTSQGQGQGQGQCQSQSHSETEVINSNSTGAAMTSADSEALEPIYLAVQSYKKRKSGEVDLHQGSTVGVMQRELSGTLTRNQQQLMSITSIY